MNRLTNRNLLQFVFAVFLFVLIPKAFGQDSLLPIQFQSINIKRSFSKDARVLSATITAGLTSDKEKFDAILSWVVMNLRYDYRRYNSGQAFSSDHSLKRVLRRRKGICTDYSNLMDSLCIYAGLQNVTIAGYVKEVNFDVNDKIYFDNHVWNAVKLNGVWFLYDPTWCSGNVTSDYRRFAKWRLKMIAKLKTRTKKQVIEFGSRVKNGKYCDLPKKTVYSSKTFNVIRFFPRMFIAMLSWAPFKTEEKYVGVTNSEFYLANPERFAVTHFPNNPIWSLSKSISSVADFISDSTYYYTPEYLSMDQSRYGTFCLECDDYESSDEIERETKNYKASLWNNPNNHLLPGNYNLTMGGHLFKQLVNETDSLTKVQLMDSTETYLLKARSDYKKARQDARVEGAFHLRKNTAKKYMLIKQNRSDLMELNKWVKLTAVKRNRIRALSAKSKSLTGSETRFLYRFNNNFSDVGTAKKMKEERIEEVRKKIDANKRYCDSLTNEIIKLQDQFKLDLGQLWLNLRNERDVAIPLMSNYYRDGGMRFFSSLDSYKYYIRELRKKIDRDKEVLLNNIDTNVLQFSDAICADYGRLVKMVKKRSTAFDKNKKNLTVLRRGGVMTEGEVRAFCAESTETIRQTICWNLENATLVKYLVITFNNFSRVMRGSNQDILWDTRMELERYKFINHHVKRNQARSRNAVNSNAKLVSSLNQILYDYRKKFESKKTI
ncbi:MAG: transglutaminase domain-containing protein [Fluviicola sp.]